MTDTADGTGTAERGQPAEPAESAEPPSPAGLAELAAAHGVATSYRDATDRVVDVDPDVVVDVLAALDVDAGTDGAVAAALARVADRPPPATVVTTAGTPRAVPGRGRLVLEDGGSRDVDGELPGDLPPGYHRLEADGRTTTVIVAPGPLAPPARTWGWSVQLYALHSAGSWGCGDLGDLATVLGRTAAEHGAGALLCSPLHALRLDPTVEASPYSPSSRRFTHPLYLRVADTAGHADAPPEVRAAADRCAPPPTADGLLDLDAVWDAKRAALALLRPFAPDDVAADALDDLDPELRDVATWTALAERHGPEWREWPADLRAPDAPGIAAARAELADRIGFHAWCQRMLDAQLAAAHAAARGGPAPMAVGLIADLAVGCAPDGADAWALQAALAPGVHVGAPPDGFNPHGQDWSLPPWRPDALEAAGYAPLRSMLRAVLRHADGVRVDHVAGLWRLWWIPPGRPAHEGTYVHYDAGAMLAVLALEAHRAGAVVVGEDLGTVEPEVTAGLADRGMLGCAVLWFQRREDGTLRPPQEWGEDTLASVSTHDLPTAVGFLRDEHVHVRAAAGLIDDAAAAAADAARERDELLAVLVEQGLLGASRPHTEDEIVAALHALLARARSRVALAAFTDVVDEPRQPNLPGTTDAYPNWRIPLPLPLERLLVDPRVVATAATLRER